MNNLWREFQPLHFNGGNITILRTLAILFQVTLNLTMLYVIVSVITVAIKQWS